MKTARPFQVEALNSVLEDFAAGHKRLVLSMATGTGKTFTFSELHSRVPGKTLIVAHTEELIDQTISTLREMYPEIRVDKEMANHRADPDKADVVVASVKSLGRKGTKRVDKYKWDEFTKVIIDEAHHTPAQSYRNILDAAGCFQSGNAKLLLGVTATTQRADGRALSDYYGRISYVYSLRQAIEDGWLVDVRGYRVNTETSLNGLGNSGGDFNVDELGDKINNPKRNERVVSAWEQLGESRRTVVFAATIAHAQALAQEFKDRGHAFEAIWGDDPNRDTKLADHKAGRLKGLVNVGIMIEGYDDWQISCIVPARPTQSECLFTQMCGRGTRLEEGTGNLKTGMMPAPATYTDNVKRDCIIIDVVDNTSSHSLVSLPSLMGLPNDFDLKGRSAVKAKQELEALQEQYPNIDFKHLKAVDEAPAYVEQVNMLEVRFPAEVESNSPFKWSKTVDGGYRINIPGPAINQVGQPIRRAPSTQVEIYQDMLDKWQIRGLIKGEQFRGERPTMEAAFVAADNAIRQRAGQLIDCLNRKESWHDNPMTAKQKTMLSRLYRGRQWPEGMTAGTASFWIDKKVGRKA